MIHFFLTAGELKWQYRRAIETAKVHGTPITLWHVGEEAPRGLDCYTRRLRLPVWLEGQHPATIYDLAALKTLYVYGGMALGLDSISIRPALDLLPEGKELAVGIDVPFVGYTNPDIGRLVTDPFNNHLIARPGSSLLLEMYDEGKRRVLDEDGRWGATGPLLLTSFVLDNPDRVAIAPFPTLCGWEGSYIWRFYQGEEPGPDVRVIHLYSSAYTEEFSTFQYEPVMA